jgi:hypothetical protein
VSSVVVDVESVVLARFIPPAKILAFGKGQFSHTRYWPS